MSQENDEVGIAYECCHKTAGDQRMEDLSPVFMLHGLTDNRRTWDGLYRDIAIRTGRRVYTVDARNHGDSDWSDNFNIDVLADDVIKLMDLMDIEKAIFVGHSMGGLIAMNIAHRQPEKVEMMIIEDMTPDVLKANSDEVLTFVKILRQSIFFVPENVTESEAQETIQAYLKVKCGENLAVVVNQLKENYFAIRAVKGVWQWKMNVDIIIMALQNTESFLSKVERKPYSGEALFIYGTDSQYNVLEDKENILNIFPKAEFVGIEGAGHNIHPYFPQFQIEVLKFLERSTPVQ